MTSTASSPTTERHPLVLKTIEAGKQLLCGGVAGAVAKTVTAPLSRLTILFQVHSMVTTKDRPNFSAGIGQGLRKIVERGGILSLWKGNATSVLHRFPFSAINFAVYESALDAMHNNRQEKGQHQDPSPLVRFAAGATAGTVACIGCYPLDLVRTRLTTELPGREHYRGIGDAFKKITRAEGILGLYSGLGATLFVAVPNFAISYTVYGTLKEHVLEDELFYNLRQVVHTENGKRTKMGFYLTLMCGAASGGLATLATFPFDTVRRRMQIQNLHIPQDQRQTSYQQITSVIRKEGILGLYRGLTPELLKVIPMVGTMFFVYEFMKDTLDIKDRKSVV